MNVGASKDWVQQLYIREFGNKLLPSDFYWEDGNMVMTESYHKRRGRCCGNGCINCPFEPRHERGNTKIKESLQK